MLSLHIQQELSADGECRTEYLSPLPFPDFPECQTFGSALMGLSNIPFHFILALRKFLNVMAMPFP